MGNAVLGYTEGAGADVAVDLVTMPGSAAGAAQYMKLIDGTEGGTDFAVVDSIYGIRVDTVERRATLPVAPTVDTLIYAPGDTLFEPIEVTGAGRAAIGTGQIESVGMVDAAGQDSVIDLVFFSAIPGGTYTVNTAFAPTLADLKLIVGTVHLAAADYIDYAAGSFIQQRPVSMPYVLPGTSLWLAAVAGGTPTYVTASDLTLDLTITLD